MILKMLADKPQFYGECFYFFVKKQIVSATLNCCDGLLSYQKRKYFNDRTRLLLYKLLLNPCGINSAI